MQNFSLNGNYIDLVIILVVLYFIIEGYGKNIWISVISFISFLASLLFSLKFYYYVSHFIQSNFSLSGSISNAMGFLLMAVILEGLIATLLFRLVKKLTHRDKKRSLINLLSVIPSVGEALVIVSFSLFLLLALPVAGKIKTDVTSSRIGGLLVRNTQGVEVKLKEIFGGVIEDSITYITVEPGSDKKIILQSPSEKLSVDEDSENSMFSLVNSERIKAGIPELEWYAPAVSVARNHAQDMWERRYFSHYSPEGRDVGDRLDEAGINYLIAGENLALAPTLQTAHTGLMNSEGHKRNILDPEFRKISIGVIDNGIYGKMFVQVFIK